MEIKFAVKGKEVIIPQFELLSDQPNRFFFTFVGVYDESIQKQVNSKDAKIYFENDNLILESKNIDFYFDLKNNDIFKLNEKYFIGFLFYDENNEIIEHDYHTVFSFSIN